MAVEVWLTTSCDRPSVHRPAVNRAARDTPGSLCVAEGTALALPIRQSWAHLLTREAVVAGVSHRTLTIRSRVGRELKRPAEFISCYEAGYDGFWLHRLLEENGVRNYVTDPASLQVDRRARDV